MSSSFFLKKRKEQVPLWAFRLPDSTLGGQDDHYVRPFGNCHPDFTAIVIGDNPDGVKICVRRTNEDGSRIANAPSTRDNSRKYNGFHRFSPRLYDVEHEDDITGSCRNDALQKFNPDRYYDRHPPYEGDLITRDYLKPDIYYSGTGIHPIHTPALPDKATCLKKPISSSQQEGAYTRPNVNQYLHNIPDSSPSSLPEGYTFSPRLLLMRVHGENLHIHSILTKIHL
jgi:hypothetical protein